MTLPWSGEYVVQVNGARSAPGNGVAANVFSYPNGIAIPFDNIFGRSVRFNELSIRVRNLNQNSPACAVTVHVLGYAE